MAKEETFLLVSLKEKESKKLAQVISNNTSRKILNFLAENDATESEIAKKLGIPISTVHYNLKHLLKAKLVDSKEYHYSEKGKEVNHYSLSKKYIIIAPAGSRIKTKLKSILPMVIVIGAGAAIIHFITSIFTGASFGAAKTAEVLSDSNVAQLAYEEAETAIVPTADAISTSTTGLPIAFWFLIGGIVAILTYLIIILIKRKK